MSSLSHYFQTSRLRRVGFVVAVVVATLGVSLAASGATRLTLSARSIGPLHLGESQRSAVIALDRLSATKVLVHSTPLEANCGVRANASADGLALNFNHGRLVGIGVGPGGLFLVLTPSHFLLAGRYDRLVSHVKDITASGAQGGTYRLRVPSLVRGFLSSWPVTPRTRVLSVDMGLVGCPAMSP